MARQEGVIKIKGQMGGISFYKSQDGLMARQKGGIDSERIKNDPAFARTRENGAEFGRAGSSGKLLRTALRSLIMNVSDNRMISRLTQAMMKVVQSDLNNLRGERNAGDGDVTLLTGFEFNQNAKLDKTFFAPYTPTIDRATGALTLDIPDYVPGEQVIAPSGTTHYRLISGAALVDFKTGAYEGDFSQSDALALGSLQQPALTLTQQVTGGSTASLFLAFGITFYQEVNGHLYP
ncbi:MAG: hypothetical protein WBO32_01925, partial [Cyclobacteriaceae bacterium]